MHLHQYSCQLQVVHSDELQILLHNILRQHKILRKFLHQLQEPFCTLF